jgi:predicted aminopeptidase
MKFRTLYAIERPPDRQRQAKRELFDALRRDYTAMKAGWGGYAGFDGMFGADLNNARLVSFSLYNEWVAAFEVILEQVQLDLPRFYRRVALLAALDKEARRNALISAELSWRRR